MRLFAISAAFFCLLISACAMPLAPSDMTPLTEVYSQIPANKGIERKVSIGNVTVSEDAKVYGAVTPAGVGEALQTALLTANLSTRAGDKAAFVLDARVDAIDYPAVGFNLDCYATITYSLNRSASGASVDQQTVKSHYYAAFGEAFDGNIRMRLCISRAIRENITHYLRSISAKSGIK